MELPHFDLGAAVAFSRYDIALVLNVVNLVALRWLRAFKHEPTES